MSEKEAKVTLVESTDPSWVAFRKWAENKNNSIDMNNKEDWEGWWDCWLDGFNCARNTTS